jgi:chromosome segregation ATPase
MEFSENGPLVPFNLMQHRLVELKEILLNRFDSMESALKDAEESVTRELQQAEQTKEQLKGEVSRLEAQLREKEDRIREKDDQLRDREAAMKELEERLRETVQALENQLKDRDQLLGRRDAELKEMRIFLSRIREKESALSQAEALAERIKESLKVEVSRLETQLKESEGNFHGCAPENEENPTIKVHELEDRIRREGILEKSQAE